MTPEQDAQQFITWRVACIAAAREGKAMPPVPRHGRMASPVAYGPPPISPAAEYLQRQLERIAEERIAEAAGHES